MFGRLQGTQSPKEEKLRAVGFSAPEVDRARWREAEGKDRTDRAGMKRLRRDRKRVFAATRPAA